ncbi:hypothetical protein B9Z55_007413 [Caenorhabditis nigoni]|uniref:Uncharacterized protein n=1 Tax=Caenorhabditis nigoni TaxID=1611254 RepID=A0A2G5V9X4_9PELO|nr:hypothetical protein B9Z55_007413 [Caenorhabditis nigoni]
MAGFHDLDFLDLDAPGSQKDVRSEQSVQMEHRREQNSDLDVDYHPRGIAAELVPDSSGSTDSEKASELARILKYLQEGAPVEETIRNAVRESEEELTYGPQNVNPPSSSATTSTSEMFQPHNHYGFPSFDFPNPPFADFVRAHRFGAALEYSQNPDHDSSSSTSEVLYPPGFYGFPASNFPNPGSVDFGPSHPYDAAMGYLQEPDQATIVEFEKNVALWSQKYKYNPLILEEELVLDEYLFDPNGKREVPQVVKKPVNSRSLYQNQRSERQGWTPYNSLGEEEKMKWYKMWDKLSQRQREQFKDGLIRFKSNKNFS